MKNKDVNSLIDLLIKMKDVIIKEHSQIITTEDFFILTQIIQTEIDQKQKASKRAAQYNKDHAEKHRTYNREWSRKNNKRKED